MDKKTSSSPPLTVELTPDELRQISVQESNEKIVMGLFKKNYPGFNLKLSSAGAPFSLNSIKFNDIEAVLDLLYYKVYNFLNEECAGLYWCEGQDKCWGYGQKHWRYVVNSAPEGFYVYRESQRLDGRRPPRSLLGNDCVRLLERNQSTGNYYYPDLPAAKQAAELDHDTALNSAKKLLWRMGETEQMIYATAGDTDYMIRVENFLKDKRTISIDKRNLQDGPTIRKDYKTNLPSVRAAAKICQDDFNHKTAPPPHLEII